MNPEAVEGQGNTGAVADPGALDAQGVESPGFIEPAPLSRSAGAGSSEPASAAAGSEPAQSTEGQAELPPALPWVAALAAAGAAVALRPAMQRASGLGSAGSGGVASRAPSWRALAGQPSSAPAGGAGSGYRGAPGGGLADRRQGPRALAGRFDPLNLPAAPPGYQWVKKRMPKYETRTVRIADYYEEPVYEKRRVKVGTREILKEIPIFKTVTVDQGHWAWRKVTRTRTEAYLKAHRTWYEPQEVAVRYRGDWVRRRRYVRRSVPIYGRRKVEYTTWEQYWVSRPVQKRVIVGYENRVYEEDVYQWKDVQIGTRRVAYPRLVQRKVPVGEQESWVLARVPETPTMRPPRTQSPTPEPVVAPVPPAEPLGTAQPPASLQATDLEGPDAGQQISLAARALARIAKWGRKFKRLRDVAPLQFSLLEDEYVSVRVSDAVPHEGKIAFRQKLGFAGTRYSRVTAARISADQVWKSGRSNAGLGLALGLSVVQNVVDYGWGENKEKGFGNEFAASTMVDFAKAGIVGLASAGIVAGVVAGAAAIGITLVAGAPLWAIMAGASVVGIALSVLVDHFVDTDKLKQDVAGGLSAWGGIVDNTGIIVGEIGSKIAEGAEGAWQDLTDAAKNAAEGMSSMVQDLSQAASTGLEEAKEAVREGVSAVRDTVAGFFGNAFGGGGG